MASVVKAPSDSRSSSADTPTATASSAGTEGELRPVPFKITNLERIPAPRSYDKEFYDLECKHLWPYVWQMACREEEIPEIGDWVQYTNLDQSIIVVRTRNGIKAFNNACRHRGTELAVGHGNCETTGFICPYHGWRYNMEGKNTFVYAKQIFSKETLESGLLNLVPVRLELWGGCVWINFDDDALPLMECIEPFTKPFEGRNVEKVKIEHWTKIELPVNWKTAMEAFMEGYHTKYTHAAYHAKSSKVNVDRSSVPYEPNRRVPDNREEFIDAFIESMKALGHGFNGMIRPHNWEVAEAIRDTAELPSDPEQMRMTWYRTLNDEIVKRRSAQGVPMPDLNNLPPVQPSYFCFPHYVWLPTFDNILCYRVRPLGPEKSIFELFSMILYPEDEVRPRPVAPKTIRFDDPSIPSIPAEDYENIPRQQRGFHTKGFDYQLISTEKEGTISRFHQVIDGFIAGLDKKELARGQRIACAYIDAPLADVGFRDKIDAREP